MANPITLIQSTFCIRGILFDKRELDRKICRTSTKCQHMYHVRGASSCWGMWIIKLTGMTTRALCREDPKWSLEKGKKGSPASFSPSDLASQGSGRCKGGYPWRVRSDSKDKEERPPLDQRGFRDGKEPESSGRGAKYTSSGDLSSVIGSCPGVSSSQCWLGPWGYSRLCESPGKAHTSNHGKVEILDWISFECPYDNFYLYRTLRVAMYVFARSSFFFIFDYSCSTFPSGASRQKGVYPEPHVSWFPPCPMCLADFDFGSGVPRLWHR